MHRLLAEVRSRKLASRHRGGNGLPRARYVLRVKVLGSAIDELEAPERVVGREVSVRRDCIEPWTARKGDLIVLDPVESARILCPRKPGLEDDLSTDGGVLVVSCDVDRDGFPEDVVENRFARATLQPHRGARLSSLRGAGGEDRFARPFEYTMAGKYVLLGGAEELVVEGGSPGKMWKSAFERKEIESGSDASEIAYSHKLESPEGIHFEKSVRMEPWLPGVLQSYSVLYAGKRKRGEAKNDADGGKQVGRGAGTETKKEKKDETDVTFAIRMSTATPGDTPSLNVFEIPCADGVHRVRYHPPGFGRRWRWRDWRDEHFGLRGGFMVSRHEESGNVLAVLFNGRRTSFVSVRSDYTGPEVGIVHSTRRLAKGRRFRTGAAFLVGDAVAVGGGSMLLATMGSPRGGRRPVALTLRTAARVDRVRARFGSVGNRRTAGLSRRALTEVGDVYVGVVELEVGTSPVTVSARVGGERLSLELEA